MKEILAECRYGQYGCDYILIQYFGYDEELIEQIRDLAENMSNGDCAALDYAQPKLNELELNGMIIIVKLNIVND